MPKLLGGLRDRIGRVRDARRESRRLAQPPVMTPHGFLFRGHPAMESGTFEPDEVAIFRELLPKVDLVINVGANAGYYVCLCVQANKPIIAIEPLPLNLSLLYRNVRTNDWQDRVEIHPVAVAERTGIIDLYGTTTGASLVPGWAGARTATAVACNTLDNLVADRIQGKRVLILVDIEGAEFGLLRGAQRVLAATVKPTWLMEISVDEHRPADSPINPHLRETFDLLWSHGYRAVTANKARAAVTQQLVDASIADRRNRLGHYNFLFQA